MSDGAAWRKSKTSPPPVLAVRVSLRLLRCFFYVGQFLLAGYSVWVSLLLIKMQSYRQSCEYRLIHFLKTSIHGIIVFFRNLSFCVCDFSRYLISLRWAIDLVLLGLVYPILGRVWCLSMLGISTKARGRSMLLTNIKRIGWLLDTCSLSLCQCAVYHHGSQTDKTGTDGCGCQVFWPQA